MLLRRRHRDWYRELVLRAEEDLITERQVAWQSRLDRELPNVRAAMEFCLSQPGEAESGLRIVVALHPYWTRGRLSEGRQWLDRMLTGQAGPPTALSARAVYDAAMLAGFHGDVPAAAALVARAHRLADQLGDDRSRVLAVQADGNMSVFAGELSHAVACYEQVLEIHRADGNLPRLLEALIGLAFTSGLMGDWPRVTQCHEEMLAITEPRGEAWYRSYSLYDLGFAMWRQGEPDRAADLFRQSLRLRLLVDDPLSTALSLEGLAWIAAGRDDHHHAAVLLGAAEALSQGVGTPTATFPDLLEYHDDCEQRIRQALGDRAFLEAFEYGRDELGFAGAVAHALRDAPEGRPGSGVVPAPGPLSRRERQVAELIADGLTNQEIADRLVISRRTAEGHVEHILVKLCLATRAQVAAWIVAERANAAPAVPLSSSG